MPITVSCPSCGGKINAPDNLAGRKVKCPKCSAPMMLPSDNAVTEAIQTAAPAPAAPPPPSAPPPRSRPARPAQDDDYYDDEPRDTERIRVRAGGPNGLAIAGMVLGIVGFIMAFIPCLGWVLAIIMGIVGTTLSGIGLAGANKVGSGKGMAIAGLILSILAVIWGPAWFFIYFYSAVNTVNQAVQQAVNNQKNFQNQNPFLQPGGVPQGQPTPVSGKIALNNGQATMQGNLANNDPRDRVMQASACKVYTLDMVAGKTYQIDMTKNDNAFDPFLRLEDSAGKHLTQDDDGGGNLNARILFNCQQTGQYRVVATCLFGTGNFTLQVVER